MPSAAPCSLAQLTARELKTTHWQAILPGLYSLGTVIENNGGHDHQSVLDHIIGVMAGMEKIIQGEFLSEKSRQVLTTYLNQKLANHSHLELLRLAIMAHDLAKGETLLTNSQGITSCPAHEILAVAKIPQFQTKFGLESSEVKRVQAIVRVHDFPHSLLGVSLAKPAAEASLFSEFVTAIGDTIIEVIILVYADILGSSFAQLNPTEFAAREKLCQTWLDRSLRSV